MKLNINQMQQFLDEIAQVANDQSNYSLVDQAIAYKEQLTIFMTAQPRDLMTRAEIVNGLINFREASK